MTQSAGSRQQRVHLAGAPAWLWAAALAIGAVSTAHAADWPHYRGPSHNGASVETGWQSRWPAAGPRTAWTAQIGSGYSTVAVVGDRVYAIGNASNRDTVRCLNATNGDAIWQYAYPAAAGQYSGPRGTPAVEGGRVYTVSRDGLALCLAADSGRPVWRVDLYREFRTSGPQWDLGTSPLVHGNLVIYNVGKSGVAVAKDSGRTAWGSTGTPGYASPVPFTAGGQRGVAIFGASELFAVDPDNGRVLWQHPWSNRANVNAADPVFVGDQVFISSNYEQGCALLRLRGNRPTVVWENRNMRNWTNPSVIVDGHLYGNDQNSLRCIDLRTGQATWTERGMGKGGLIAADGKLIAITERGELSVATASPRAHTPTGAMQLPRGSYWSAPVLANGRIYVRSQEGALTCLDVRSGA